jgi:UDP-glucuronate 4-epimerase
MTVLITGGAGFIASHMVPYLLERTSHDLLLLDNFNDYYDPKLKRASAAALAGQKRVKLEKGDFCDFTYTRELFQRHRPNHVIHLGAYPGVPFSLQEPNIYVQNNIAGTTALLEAAREYRVERFLFASSSTVYGLGVPPPFVEDAPLGVPASPYGVSKRAAELMGMTYQKLFGVPFTSLRVFNAYGPRIRPDLALSIFTHKILAGEPIPLFGDGSVKRDFTHVSDICAGFQAALTADKIAGECINLGHNQPVEVRSLIALIEKFAGRKAIIDQRPPREGDMPFTCADLAKSLRLLGYEPKVAMEDGVREYVEWAKARPAPLP